MIIPRLRTTSSRSRSWTILLVVAVLYGVVALCLQYRCQAFRADYAGYFDEPSHYLNGLLIRDYLGGNTSLSPFAYAIDYYSHYPKVTFGHWPPLFCSLEAVWMFVFSASRTSVMVMMALQAATLCTILTLAVWTQTNWCAAIATGSSLLLLPITMEQMSMVMTEILLSIMCLAAVMAWARYQSAPSAKRNALFGLLASAAILVKGDALALAAVPPLTLLFVRDWKLLRRWHFWVAPSMVLLLCAPFYIWTSSIATLGWEGGTTPTVGYAMSTGPEIWFALARDLGIPLLVLTGFGLVACLPMLWRRQNPLVAAAISFLLAALVFQVVIPAGMEDRKLYYPLPACLIIAAIGTFALIVRWRPALSRGAAGALTALLLAGAAACNFHEITRYDRGFRDVARLLKHEIHGQESVILVSSNYFGEGLLVASVAEAHPQPAPYVIRASEFLADESWASGTYRLRAPTVEIVAKELATLQPGFLVLHNAADRGPVPHDSLVTTLVKKSPDLYRCIFTKTTQTDVGMERLEVYRAFPLAGTTPNLDQIHAHLQERLSHFLTVKKWEDTSSVPRSPRSKSRP
jgi:hypothetical protein